MFASLFKTLKIHSLVTYAAMAMALIGSYTVFTGILEFGMRYMPAIMFFTICIYTGSEKNNFVKDGFFVESVCKFLLKGRILRLDTISFFKCF